MGMGILAFGIEGLRERRGEIGLEVAKMRFLHKSTYLYTNICCSERSLAVASGAHEANIFEFSLQRGSYSLQRVAFGFWAVCTSCYSERQFHYSE